jgi:hypothetical protein
MILKEARLRGESRNGTSYTSARQKCIVQSFSISAARRGASN